MSKAKIGLILICILSLVSAVYISLNASDVSLLYILLLPLILIGDGLRALSLSSAIGNIASIIFYVILSLLPLFPLLIHIIKGKKLLKSDVLLVLISACTFAVLYLFINPQIIPSLFNSPIPSDKSLIDSEKVLIAVAYLSIWAAFLALWLLRAYKKDNLISNIEKLLYAFAVICIVSVCYTNFSELIIQITKTYAAGSTGLSDATLSSSSGTAPVADTFLAWIRFGSPSVTPPAADVLLALIRFAASVLPTLLLLKIFLPAEKLLQSIRRDPHAQESAGLAAQIVSGAKMSIYFFVGCTAVNNVLQLLLAKYASNIDMNLYFPIYQLILALSMLLLANFLAGDHKLYKENQLFI